MIGAAGVCIWRATAAVDGRKGFDTLSGVIPQALGHDPLSVDNNISERALRRVAVGRKNWLFAGHGESAQGQAMLWSLIASAQRHKLDVQFYLRSVLAHLPAIGDSQEQLQLYLADAWKRDLVAEQEAALNAHHAVLATRRGGK